MSTLREMIGGLAAQRRVNYADAELIHERAKREVRSLTPKEQTRFDELMADIGHLTERIREFEAQEARNKELGKQREANGVNRMLAAEGRVGAYLSESGESREFKQMLRGDTEITISGAEFRELHREFLADRERRDLFAGTTGAGVVPISFRQQVIENLIAASGVLQVPGLLRFDTEGGEALRAAVRTAMGGSAAKVAEGSAVPQSEATLSAGTLLAYKYGALSLLSNELISDSGVDVQQLIARDIGEQLGAQAGSALVLGTGTSEPFGIVKLAAYAGTATGGTAVSGAPSYSSIVDLLWTISSPYRANAAIVASDTFARGVRRLTDSQNMPLMDLGGATRSAMVESLLGRPFIVDPYMPAAGTGATAAVIFDPGRYALRDAGGVKIAVSGDYRFNYDETAIRGTWRIDGRPLITEAFGCFKGGAS